MSLRVVEFGKLVDNRGPAAIILPFFEVAPCRFHQGVKHIPLVFLDDVALVVLYEFNPLCDEFALVFQQDFPECAGCLLVDVLVPWLLVKLERELVHLLEQVLVCFQLAPKLRDCLLPAIQVVGLYLFAPFFEHIVRYLSLSFGFHVETYEQRQRVFGGDAQVREKLKDLVFAHDLGVASVFLEHPFHVRLIERYFVVASVLIIITSREKYFHGFAHIPVGSTKSIDADPIRYALADDSSKLVYLLLLGPVYVSHLLVIINIYI